MPSNTPIIGFKTLAVATTLTLATSSQGLFTTASKVGGKYLYNFSTVPLLSELAKLIVSGTLLYQAHSKDPKGTIITLDWKNARLYPIPSLIYLVHNNVQFMTLKYVDPSTYQILGNLKIVTTGILFRIFLHRKLNKLQWWALVLLMVGATISQVPSSQFLLYLRFVVRKVLLLVLCPVTISDITCIQSAFLWLAAQVSGCGNSTFSAPTQGYVLGLVSACLSAMAGVYTEFLMKKNDDSLYWQNCQLYSFGVLFNAIALSVDDANKGFVNGFWFHTIFDGYSVLTWCVVLNLAFTGLLVSWIQKFADTIVKVYSTSMAMLVTMLISAWLFGMQPNIQLLLGIVTASASLNLYYMNPLDLFPERQIAKEPSVKLDVESMKDNKNADD